MIILGSLQPLFCLAQTDSLGKKETLTPMKIDTLLAKLSQMDSLQGEESVYKGCSRVCLFLGDTEMKPNNQIDFDVISKMKFKACEYRKLSSTVFIDSLKLTQKTLPMLNYLPYQEALDNRIYKFNFIKTQNCPVDLEYHLSSRFELKLDGKFFKNQREKELALREISEDSIVYMQTKSPVWIVNKYYGTLEIRTKDDEYHLKTRKLVKNMLLAILQNVHIQNEILRKGEIFIDLPKEFVRYKKLLKSIKTLRIQGKNVKIRLIKQNLNTPSIHFLNFRVKNKTLIAPCKIYLGGSVCSGNFYAPYDVSGKFGFQMGVCVSH